VRPGVVPGNRLDTETSGKVAEADGQLGNCGVIPPYLRLWYYGIRVSLELRVGMMDTVGLQEPEVDAERPKVLEEFRVRTRIGRKGRIVIPAPMREAMGIAEGDVLDLRVVDGELRFSTLQSRIRRAQERARRIIKPGVSLSEELSAERREAAKRE